MELHTTNSESGRRLTLLTELTTDLENVMRESEIGIVLVDNAKNIRLITPAASDMLLIRRSDVDGEPLANYSRAFDGTDFVEVAAKEIIVTIDKRKLNLLIRVTPIFDNYDRVSAAAITLYDITTMRVAEEQLNLRTRAIDTATNGFIIVDALVDDMPLVYANQGFMKLTGFDPEEIVGRNCRFLQGPHTDPADIQKIRDAVRDQVECHVTLLNYRLECRCNVRRSSRSPGGRLHRVCRQTGRCTGTD